MAKRTVTLDEREAAHLLRIIGSDPSTGGFDAKERVALKRRLRVELGAEPCTDCMGVGYAMFETDSKHGPHGLQLQRCDVCQTYADDDEPVNVLWQTLENVFGPATGDDVDGALYMIAEALRFHAAGAPLSLETPTRRRLADCIETINHERSRQAAENEE
jgi:hypothetical protein